MIAPGITEKLRKWVGALLVNAIQNMSTAEDRTDILQWLVNCREILAGDRPFKQKFIEINHQINGRRTVSAVMNSVAETVKNYKNSNLPLPLKWAIPVTVLATPLLGTQGAGLAMLGGAVGVPALLIVFLGTTGITAVIETLARGRDDQGLVAWVLETIARDEVLRRSTKAMREAMAAEPRRPRRHEAEDVMAALRSMDPYDFECHVMSFFEAAGLNAWMTRRSNDMGVDGFARHPQGLIVVQCKRYAESNAVGRPDVQRFKGVVEENRAHLGYIVTTSHFTAQARDSAGLNARLVLVDMDDLMGWHAEAPNLSS